MATADSDSGDFHSVVSHQRRELLEAQTLESDLDLAFRLQLEEALAASMSSLPSTSSSPPRVQNPDTDCFVSGLRALQTDELDRLVQEVRDRQQSEAEMTKLREDIHRRAHDQKLAREISQMPEEEWEEYGDNYERPFGEGSSSGEVFRVFFKGLAREEKIGNSREPIMGIGVSICDFRDNLVFELQKPLVGCGKSHEYAETRAMIEALNAALALDLTRVDLFCDHQPLYQRVRGKWPPKNRKIAALLDQVAVLRKKFTYCNLFLVIRHDIKFAIKLANDAINSQIMRPAKFLHGNNLKETCIICLEDTDIGQMFSVDSCLHRYCFSCMKQHVEVKLLHGMVPKCPHEGCKSLLKIDSCGKFLTPKLIGIMSQRLKEDSIPVTEKVYCPYPRCSALMSKKEALEYANTTSVGAIRAGARKCMTCNGLFCINCMVPWHSKMTCFEYKRSNPFPQAEDAKLKSLATRNLWRQCVKCNHLIELAEGCFHITCRCGYEFCYTCGAEWKTKKATCSCPLWDEDNIWDEGDRDFDDEYYSEDEYNSEDDEFNDDLFGFNQDSYR